MNREDIIRMAGECGIAEFENNESQADNIMRFAALVAAAERERCAELCDSIAANSVLGTAGECARAIRNATNQQEDTKTLDT